MRYLLLCAALVLAACQPAITPLPVIGPSGSGHPLDGTVWDVAAGAPIEAEALAARLAAAELTVLGEIHDNALHHARQAWLVERIAPAGLAFEMVPEASEEGIAVYLTQGGTRAGIGPAIGWERLGWPDWALYRPIFAAAPDAYIAGGAVPRAELRRAMADGAATVFAAGSVAYGLDRPLPEAAQAAAEAEMVASHCGFLPPERAGAMVEAQRLRDARFAHALRRAAAMGGGPAVLITGNGHARADRGVPAYLTAAGAGEVLSLGQVEIEAERLTPADYGPLPYDFVWFSPPHDREDPCAAFR